MVLKSWNGQKGCLFTLEAPILGWVSLTFIGHFQLKSFFFSKVLCGFLAPTFIPLWQNINALNNWSVGFNMPLVPRDWFKKFDGFTSKRSKESRQLQEIGDDTRERFYRFLELQLNKFGRNGPDCVLRMICETAEAPIRHNGLIGELVYVTFR